MTRGLIVGLLAGAGLLIGGPPGLEPLAAQGGERVFELRTYTAQPGKFAAMQARFRDHIIPLFKKHGLTLVGFWTYADAPLAENTLVYILAHESREAAKRNWSAFLKDPERLKVWAESEKDGPINLDVKSVFLKAIDFSPIK
jgi:hypothetical protein